MKGEPHRRPTEPTLAEERRATAMRNLELAQAANAGAPQGPTQAYCYVCARAARLDHHHGHLEHDRLMLERSQRKVRKPAPRPPVGPHPRAETPGKS